tara:strand:- start:404 stop:625 length:222 start_codon:yes stop_codon:yes gene_type:complete
MTKNGNSPDYGLPPPITKLTLEQEFKMKLLETRLEAIYHDQKKDVITLFLALQKQNFVMGNSLKNLIEHIVIV